MTQRQRVLAALEARGPVGITQVDFLLPSVVDGRQPITRVGARIEELRRAGLDIESDGRRDSCVVYVLRSTPVESSAVAEVAVEEKPMDWKSLIPSSIAPRSAVLGWED